MTQRNRTYLQQEFQDGERPSGVDFADLMDSFLNLEDDTADLDPDGTLVLAGGLGLGDSARDEAGFLRFRGGRVQFHDGAGWQDLGSGGSSVFATVDEDGAVAYQDGNVGIGREFDETQPPTHQLEVRGEARFGNMVCGTGPTGDDSFLYNALVTNPATEYALRQRDTGEVRLNAPGTQRIRLEQNSNQTRLTVTTEGNVVVRSGSDITALEGAVFQVNGNAFKSQGGGSWLNGCDGRVKSDIRDFEAGLQQLAQVRPVRFRYNGKAGTTAGHNGVGIIGQEIERVFPEMISRAPTVPDDGLEGDDMLIFDGSALTYVLVNAVKELAAKVERLEAQLAGSREEETGERQG